jgi:hypothetical protein
MHAFLIILQWCSLACLLQFLLLQVFFLFSPESGTSQLLYIDAALADESYVAMNLVSKPCDLCDFLPCLSNWCWHYGKLFFAYTSNCPSNLFP